jgi:hypothetical protein
MCPHDSWPHPVETCSSARQKRRRRGRRVHRREICASCHCVHFHSRRSFRILFLIRCFCNAVHAVDDLGADAVVFFFTNAFSFTENPWVRIASSVLGFDQRIYGRNQARSQAPRARGRFSFPINIARWQRFETTRRRHEDDIGRIAPATLPCAQLTVDASFQ